MPQQQVSQCSGYPNSIYLIAHGLTNFSGNRRGNSTMSHPLALVWQNTETCKIRGEEMWSLYKIEHPIGHSLLTIMTYYATGLIQSPGQKPLGFFKSTQKDPSSQSRVRQRGVLSKNQVFCSTRLSWNGVDSGQGTWWHWIWVTTDYPHRHNKTPLREPLDHKGPIFCMHRGEARWPTEPQVFCDVESKLAESTTQQNSAKHTTIDVMTHHFTLILTTSD